MQSLPKIKDAIEKELAIYTETFYSQFGDDTFIRLKQEEARLRALLAMTEQFMQEQQKLEHHLEVYI